MIDIRPDHLEEVKRILEGHVPECEVRAFGSRARWTAKGYSDLDLAVVGKSKITRKRMNRLEEAFEESDLPFRVEVLDWHAISESFRNVIEEGYEVIQKAEPQGVGSESWPEIPVSEICDIFLGGTPKRSEASYWGGSIKWASAKDVAACSNRYLWDTEETITHKGIESSAAKLLEKNTIVITARGTVGALCMLGEPMSFNQTCYGLVGKDEIIPQYLYYALKAALSQVRSLSYGTVFDTITMKSFKHLMIPLPDVPEQRAIAHILGSLDDKIELNRKMNETLEDMARAIFKSWFVDFDPVRAKAEGRDTGLPKEIADLFPDEFEDSELGKIPTGWKVGSVHNLAKINPESWTKQNAPKFVEYVDLANTKNGVILQRTHYAYHDSPSRARRALRIGDTIFGTVRPGNRSFACIQESGLTGSTGFAVIRPNEYFLREFIYLCITKDDAIEYFAHIADGAAYPAIRPDVVANYESIIPPNSILKQFSLIASSLFIKMQANNEQITSLSFIRDTLLPKLISGELRVPDAEKFVEDVGI